MNRAAMKAARERLGHATIEINGTAEPSRLEWSYVAARMADVFISYRRGDSAYALLLYDRLTSAFGRERVFRDFEGIAPGETFDDELVRALKRARVLVAVIGGEWVREQARLKRQEDWVRRELLFAVREKMSIFPVLVGGARTPKARTLPADVAAVFLAQALSLSDEQFHRDADALLVAISKIVRPRRRKIVAASDGARAEQAAQLLKSQLDRIQVRAVELIEEGRLDRALSELGAGNELIMLLMDWSPAELSLDLQLGYFYKTLSQAFTAAGDRAHADQYTALAASTFERVAQRQPKGKKVTDVASLAGAINGLGNAAAQRGEFERAAELARRATMLLPSYAYAWHDRFLALDALAGQGRARLPEMREALEQVKRNAGGYVAIDARRVAALEGMLAARTAAGTPTKRARNAQPLRT
jgi:tetratricopeptide (TPR) repeat protein